MANENGGLTLDKLTEFLEDFFFGSGIEGTTGSAIPNSNGSIEHRCNLAFMMAREIKLIFEIFGIHSSNLSLLESQ
jgi:hypothetical protein